MVEAAHQESRFVTDRWEYLFLMTLNYAAFSHFSLDRAFKNFFIVTLVGLALQPYPKRPKETVSEYIVKTIFVSIYAIFAILVIPSFLKAFLPIPLAYGTPVLLFCLSKYKYSKPGYFADSFLKWSLFCLLISVVCAVLAHFLVQ